MYIQGFNKTSLLDYPGHIAAVIFTPGCNYRCPFCHNTDLVLSGITDGEYEEEYVLDVLKKRRSILEGVCITGGEPTLQSDLPDFISKIKELGYKIKLDSNGYRPEVLKSIVDTGLVDYIAMDIKNSPDKYALTCGITNFHIENIYKSIEILQTSNIEYEFRTTIVKELHTLEDILSAAAMIKGCRHYYLQSYIDSGNILEEGYSAYSAEELLAIKKAVSSVIPNVELRGVDIERIDHD
ncbi:MAG: anaerobic ribonucleoside-triphosphate reductase activating protein [Lachnospiraceae bacterium]|nr:anaerobic ribonucleoside-triphosphate reductase activating protein [Lachnospiraceae bacterium]